MKIDKAEAIVGFMDPVELEYLARRAAEARLIVEVGSWRGRSTRALCDNVRPGSKVFAVDHWKGNDGNRATQDAAVTWPVGPTPYTDADAGVNIFAEFARNLADHMAAGTLEALVGSSLWAAEKFRDAGTRPDLVFIDGDHSLEAVRADIAAWRPLVARGGILAGHDYCGLPWLAGVRQAVDEAFPAGVGLVGTIWSVYL